jgi:hypothetical protein
MKFEQPTRGAFDRSSIRYNRLIELDLATRPFTAFDVIYHTPIIRSRASILLVWPGVELNHRHADFQSLLQIDLSV